MTDDNFNLPFLEPLRRYVPLAAWIIVISVIILIPLKIIGYDYLPQDDALRHAAKAVSGKPWSEILVLSPVYKMDHEFGWNWLLAKIEAAENWDAESLVIFSVVSLFILVNMTGVLWLKRPEAWLVTLLATIILSVIPQRFMLGRPYLITVASLLAVLFLWRAQRGSPPKISSWVVMIAATAASIFFHGAWYLWALPVAAFILAGEFRWGIALGISWVAGVLIGSTLTGHPIEYPLQALQLAFLAVGAHLTQRTMAVELQPFNGDYLALSAIGGLLVLRALTKIKAIPFMRDPTFWLAGMCWVLGFKVGRFWEDWGWPALMILIASDLQQFFEMRFEVDSLKRLGLVCCIGAAAYLGVTCDFGSRWTSTQTKQYLTVDNNPDLNGWMPATNGIFYTSDMSLFYDTFFKNPHGDWRYMLGFEPTWMPKEDFEIYHKIMWNFSDSKAYQPWVDQMKSGDRLVIRGGGQPDVAGLEWKYDASGIWIGRIPQTNTTETVTNSASPATSSK
jgi:hypothetical protein